MNHRLKYLLLILVFTYCSKSDADPDPETVLFEITAEPLSFNAMKIILEVKEGKEQFNSLKDFGVVYSSTGSASDEEILTNRKQETAFTYSYTIENLAPDQDFYLKPFAEYSSGISYAKASQFRLPEYTYIPDPNLEKRLIQLGYDETTDQHILTASAKTVDSLYLTDYGVEDLTGIEDFTSLYYLHLSDGLLTELDLSANSELTHLIIPGNNLGTLDISQNKKLRHLFIANINISSIDLSQNTDLEELIIGHNSLSAIDISTNTKLVRIDIGANNLTQLDLSKHLSLKRINVIFNQLQSLSLPDNTLLEEVAIGSRYIAASNSEEGNKIKNLDFSNYSELKHLKVNNLGLEGLDLSNNPFLEYLEAEGNVFNCVTIPESFNQSIPDSWYLDPDVSICNPQI